LANEDIILSVNNLETVYITGKNRSVKAVDNVSFAIRKGEFFGLAGESGCGKSTLVLSLLNLVPPPGKIRKGEIVYYGWGDPVNILTLKRERLRRYRWEQVSMVFQAAQSALNPVAKIKDHFLDTAMAHGLRRRREIYRRALKLLNMVRLDKSVLDAYPHQLSGGMKQRVIIALSLLLNPKILILDEPTSALDLVTQKYILDMVREIGENLGLTVIFVTHDLSLLAGMMDRIGIMYAGKMVEIAPVEDIFYNPHHPYTSGLMKAIPSLVGDISTVKSIPGDVPNLVNPPPGCRFAPRCPYATDVCRTVEPKLERVDGDKYVACHRWRELELSIKA